MHSLNTSKRAHCEAHERQWHSRSSSMAAANARNGNNDFGVGGPTERRPRERSQASRLSLKRNAQDLWCPTATYKTDADMQRSATATKTSAKRRRTTAKRSSGKLATDKW